MVDFLYGTLEAVGFTHPLHPALVHIPMGMVIGCFFFTLVTLVWKKEVYIKTSLHCSVIAAIFILPSIIAGFLDWLYFFNGTWSALIIIKMILATILTGLLLYSIRMNMQGAPVKNLFIVYALCLACAGGLGFSGGELVYG